VLEAWGKEWQGLLGVEGQVPSSEQLLRPLIGSQGLLVLTPGRLLSHVGTQVRWSMPFGTPYPAMCACAHTPYHEAYLSPKWGRQARCMCLWLGWCVINSVFAG
jgi:hypothetical protein